MTTGTGAEAPRGPLTRGQTTRLLAILFLANVVNFYDRTIPAVVVEPIKDEFGLSDTMIGLLGGSFTVVYAIAGVLLGRLADRVPRRYVMAGGLFVWSLFTLGSGLASAFLALFLFRLGVGIGEASYAPAANTVVFDAFPPKRRSRAISILAIGSPVGLLAAFLTVGIMVEAFDSWRAPFVVAAVPGFVLAAAFLFLPEPGRGASETEVVDLAAAARGDARPLRSILAVPTVRWLMLAGIGLQVANYAVATFIVPLLQRYFGLSIGTASVGAGMILGVAGILGLLVGGVLADRAATKGLSRRLVAGAVGFVLAVPLSIVALVMGSGSPMTFIAVFAVAMACVQVYGAAATPAIADVTPPKIRATAIALYFAAFNIIGATLGPIIAGVLSDAFAQPADGLSAEAVGLHRALLVVVPCGIAVAALGAWRASRTLQADHERVTAS